MPHLILEYSKSLSGQIDPLLSSIHEALVAAGIDRSRLKTRAIEIQSAYVGDKGQDGAMMHATLLLLEGRDLATKKLYGDAAHAEMKSAAPEGTAVTLEIRDMVKDTYYL